MSSIPLGARLSALGSRLLAIGHPLPDAIFDPDFVLYNPRETQVHLHSQRPALATDPMMALRLAGAARIVARHRLCYRNLATESTSSAPKPPPPSAGQQQQQQQQQQKQQQQQNQQNQQKQQAQPGGPMSWKALAVAAAVGTAGLAYYSYERERRIKEITRPKAVGRADIGGPFSLTDDSGKRFTHDDLRGRWTLLYFGFTMCPDICPDELTTLSEALALLEKRGRPVRGQMPLDGASDPKKPIITPIFISIDPERDTPRRTGEYAREFHPAFVGLSGSLDEVSAMAKKFRIYFSKDETPGDDYLVDHSIISYLMDPNGEFQEFFGKNATAAEVAGRIETKMLALKPS